MCDPFVFNTVITRTKSLVVSVGNPFTLLKMERGMPKKCWSEYLKLCCIHQSLVTSESVQNVDMKLDMLKEALFGSQATVQCDVPGKSINFPLFLLL